MAIKIPITAIKPYEIKEKRKPEIEVAGKKFIIEKKVGKICLKCYKGSTKW